MLSTNGRSAEKRPAAMVRIDWQIGILFEWGEHYVQYDLIIIRVLQTQPRMYTVFNK